MSIAKVSILIIFLSVGLVGCSTSHTSGPPTELKLDNLLRKSLAEEFTPGREIVVS